MTNTDLHKLSAQILETAYNREMNTTTDEARTQIYKTLVQIHLDGFEKGRLSGIAKLDNSVRESVY